MPSFLVMTVIFYFSSQPGDSLPDFHDWDYFVKKAGHMMGYGLLALANLYAVGNIRNKYFISWLIAFVFATSDEFHQSFVPGRGATIVDVLLFDAPGALTALWLAWFLSKNKEG